MYVKHWIAAVLMLLAGFTIARGEIDPVSDLQGRWAEVNYRTPEKDRADGFARLVEDADRALRAQPNNPELLIWQGIVLASYASAKGGLKALSLVKRAKSVLEKAIAIDDTALDGSAYTTLGSIYYQVPGWPLGFGNDDQAHKYLQKALELNPYGIDPNFWYASFLVDQHRYQEALDFLQRAQAAPPRPGRELADQGRRREIEQLMIEVRDKLHI